MNIIIFQPMLKQYRVPLFELMGRQLAENGHQLRVVCGSPPPHELNKGDNIFSSEGYSIVEKSFWFFNAKVHFLPNAFRHILWADFIITEQANRHIHNYLLMVFRLFGFKKFAYWGHGKNWQAMSNSLPEVFKKVWSTHCDWWFSYTKNVAKYVASLGYPSSKITVLNNSIDTSVFKKQLAEQSPEKIFDFKNNLSISDSARIGLFCGSLYENKKLKFLLDSSLKVHLKNPNFVLLVVGDGEEKQIVEEFANQHSFIKYLGPLFGEQKALAFKSSEIFLCPGLVGLAILDAFSSSLPLFTSDYPHHSPEIEYLEHNFNGVMTRHIEDEYAQAIVDIFNSPQKLARLQDNAFTSSNKFSIENMALNFVEGIEHFFANRN